MPSPVQKAVDTINQLPRRHKLALGSVLLVMAALAALPGTDHDPISLSLPDSLPAPPIPASHADSKTVALPDLEYQIQSGDTLSNIFSRLGLNQQTMYQVLEADQPILALDTLKPGDVLRFWLNPATRQLTKLELRFSAAHQVIFSRVDDDSFTFQKVDIDGVWRNQPVGGEVNGSFYVSAHKVGLSDGEIAHIANLFKDKLNFSRDLRAGDRFQIVRRNQYIDGKPTGDSELEAIRIENQGRTLSAFLFSDGSYYDEHGKSLMRAFRRYPTAHRYRISSPFNPHRYHPVTHHYAPHYGTDFATPVGTPVLSTADGVVTRIAHHPYAGRYIVIKHGGTYATRYLHLSKVLVHKGEVVSRGQRIALSGATGRVTGPHLHYELLIHGHPVNAMTAKIPMSQGVASKDKPAFLAEVKNLQSELDQAPSADS
ncbi:peptidoglycan DD-metalloendopeptidase family protein [Gallaecimonas sp. GXIMD1310]|uniref:peptidoglycan DD-metalloendopeptidase family protein n=1 Tax=Gallaecimonas sp. GXIMD1310 TaxID=3131926 RepID=UPI0032470F96